MNNIQVKQLIQNEKDINNINYNIIKNFHQNDYMKRNILYYIKYDNIIYFNNLISYIQLNDENINHYLLSIDKYGLTPLHIYIDNNYYHILSLDICQKLLLNIIKNISLYKQNILCYVKNIKMFKIIISSKINIDDIYKIICQKTNDDKGNSILHIYAIKNYIDLYLYIYNNYNIPEICLYNNLKQLPLHIICKNGYTRFLNKILIYNTNINIQDKLGWSFLHYAALGQWPKHESHVDIIKILIKNNININIQEYGCKWTALHTCTDAEAVKLLINYNADVNIKDVYGRTPLYYCNHMAIPMLLNAKADINIIDHDQRTPLHNASNILTAQVLIESKCDINKKDNQNKTAYDMAIETERYDIAKYLNTLK